MFRLNVKLSVPEYALPFRSVPDTVAVVEANDVDTVHVYSHTDADDVAVINASDVIPEKDIVGVPVIALEKVAVMVV